MTEISKILKIIRAEHGIYLQDMADMLGVTRSYVSRIEVGKAPMPEEWIYRFQKEYHIPEETVKKLQQLVCTRDRVQLFPNNDAQRELLLKLARRLNHLDGVKTEALQALLDQDESEQK